MKSVEELRPQENEGLSFGKVVESVTDDVRHGDSKENVMIQLNRVQESTERGEEACYYNWQDKIQSGDIKSLARNLYDLLPVHHGLRSNESCFDCLDNSRKVRIVILCSVIERMLYSPSTITTVECNDDLAACLPHVMESFACGPGYSTIRLNTIGNCIRIMLCLNNPSPQIAARFIESLLSIIDCGLLVNPSVILDYASQAIVRFITASKGTTVLTSVEQKIDTLFLILQTSISSEDRRQSVKALECLGQLARVSSFASHITNHHVLVFGICRHLTDSTHSVRVRKKAIDLVGMLIVSHNFQQGQAFRREMSMELIVDALTRAVLKEAKAKLQKCMLSNLLELLKKEGIGSNLLLLGMESLLGFAFSGNLTEEVTMESAIAYLHAARKLEEEDGVLSNVVDFTTSTFAIVRKHALKLLHDITFWNLTAPRNLLSKTIILECFALILDQGSDRDNADVLSICQQLLFEKGNEYFFFQSSNMMQSLVSLVTQGTITNRVVYVSAVDLVLNLLEDDSNVPYFLCHSNLLPWLIKTSNRTTDELLKERLVPIIVRLSAALLKTHA